MNEFFLLILIFFLGIVGHNQTVSYASAIVIAFKIFGEIFNFPSALQFFGEHGLNFGILILTAAILVPIADGTITFSTILNSFKSSIGIIALIAGLLAAISGGVGVPLMQKNPQVIPALIIGTMIGVFFFKGIAVGPLIAAGFTYFVLEFLNFFK